MEFTREARIRNRIHARIVVVSVAILIVSAVLYVGHDDFEYQTQERAIINSR